MERAAQFNVSHPQPCQRAGESIPPEEMTAQFVEVRLVHLDGQFPFSGALGK